MKTLITGATGTIGRLLIADLIERGVPVRGLSRNPTEARLPPDVDVIAGSLADAPVEAFDGIESVFLFPADRGVDQFVERAVAAGIRRFTVLSSLAVSERNERDGSSATARHHGAVEVSVTSRTDEWTILRPGNFASNLLFWSFRIRSGSPVSIPYPTSSQVLIHEADVAASAAVALTESAQAGRVYELTGPESLTKIEQLAAIGAAVGRELPFVEVSPEEFTAEMTRYMSSEIVAMLLRYWAETVSEPETPLPSPFRTPRRTLARWAEDRRTDFIG